jgi:hypothetical protein
MTGICEVIQVLPDENVKNAMISTCHQPLQILKHATDRVQITKSLAVFTTFAKNLSLGPDQILDKTVLPLFSEVWPCLK